MPRLLFRAREPGVARSAVSDSTYDPTTTSIRSLARARRDSFVMLGDRLLPRNPPESQA